MRVVPALVTVLLLIVADQWSKYAITSHFAYGESLPVISGFFNLVLVYNSGAAFSFLSGESGWQRWFFIG
ncbi:MAG TPA: signal peptidase II, partial [Burkholderiales bacterium]|nr:signal peptidase II [Burkholderiales bacterium]